MSETYVLSFRRLAFALRDSLTGAARPKADVEAWGDDPDRPEPDPYDAEIEREIIREREEAEREMASYDDEAKRTSC